MRWWLALCVLAGFVHPAQASEPAAEGPVAQTHVLFDFEDPAEIGAWENLASADGNPADVNPAEPAVRFEQSPENAASGEHSLKLTFAGGDWPTITTARVPADWMAYGTFQAEVTVARHCVVGFSVLQEKSQRGGGWDATVSRWTKTALLGPGTSTVSARLHDPDGYYAINSELGPVVRFEIFMYKPESGESIHVDRLRIVAATEEPPRPTTEFQVLGAGLTVSGVAELGRMLKDDWTPPIAQSLEQVEADIRARYDELKQEYPRAVLAVFRDGDRGYDPAHPDRVFAGWKDAYWSSHGPDGMTVERATNTGGESGHEVFMRHRSPLMQVDFSTIPKGSQILAARLIVVRDFEEPIEEHHPGQPNMWVVEPCNRPWEELRVNAYEYAEGKFWRAIGGMHWGDDPDFHPVYLAYGPSQGKVNSWDFAEAVRFWTDGRHPNHGFMLHGDAGDWLVRAHAREAEQVVDRPAVWVVYVPAE